MINALHYVILISAHCIYIFKNIKEIKALYNVILISIHCILHIHISENGQKIMLKIQYVIFGYELTFLNLKFSIT